MYCCCVEPGLPSGLGTVASAKTSCYIVRTEKAIYLTIPFGVQNTQEETSKNPNDEANNHVFPNCGSRSSCAQTLRIHTHP
jgi:hypothetical protein